jgi:hypothetical protein
MQMRNGKNVNGFSIATVDDRIWKAINKGSPNRQANNCPNIGVLANEPDGALHFRGKQTTQSRDARLVKLCSGR